MPCWRPVVPRANAHLSLPDLPVCLDPPRSGSGPVTEGQARLRVSVRQSPFLDHEMSAVTDGLEPEEPACWACLGRGRREDQTPQPPTVPRSMLFIIPEPSAPAGGMAVFKRATFRATAINAMTNRIN